ncbi:Aste57867_4995 [Aphanomyces stellatus]|uniref:Aste57867_4995 protein n=1 Tax=Aphanomyces stellatus TaxID=120398 RepID=A0A485KER7_9STRA|nr:hypothetical protein As57867_004982 [Aphanomyces stellatus]VFT82080.1 Aste57867_4995 [Aphanomyces stellatus]
MHVQVVSVGTASSTQQPLVSSLPASFQWLRRCILGFALLKHLISVFYLAAQIVIFHRMNRTQADIVHAYALPTVGVVYMCLVAIHIASILHRIARAAGLCFVSSKARPSTCHPIAWVLSWLSQPSALAAYNLVELGCQSYEAFAFTTKLIDPTLVAVYVVFVALHAMLAPWGLHQRSTPRLLFVNWLSSLLTFYLSCVLHIVGLTLPLLYFTFIDSTVNRDPLWLTRNVLYADFIFVTSPLDFVAKVVVHVGSLVSISRLVAAVDRVYSLNHRSKLDSGQLSRGFRLYRFCSTIWGAVLLGSLVHAFYGRQACPSTCAAYVTPLWTTDCQCMYIHVNCHALGHDDVDAALQPSRLSAHAISLLMSRCDLPDGINATTLNQFESLNYIGVKFTNTSTWRGPLPPSTVIVAIEYAAFTTVPDILTTNVPSSLGAVWLNNLPLTTPITIPHAWAKLTFLGLNNLTLSALPSNVTSLNLSYLFVHMNELTILPSQSNQVASLTYVDASANVLHEGPWSLLQPGSTLLLCENPFLNNTAALDTIEPVLRQAYLTKANQACGPLCAPTCFPYFLGDHTCHLSCFNAACDYDHGDCDAFGFDRLG